MGGGIAERFDLPAGDGGANADASLASNSPGERLRAESCSGRRHARDDSKALSADERINVQLLQRTLGFLLNHTAREGSDSGKAGSGIADAKLSDLKKRFDEERQSQFDQPVRFGPATKEAYGRCLQWLECQAVPDALRKLKEGRLDVPKGLPEPAPLKGSTGDPSRQVGRSAGAHPSSYSLGLDAALPPSAEQMQTLGLTIDWLRRAESAVDFSAIRSEIETTIRKNHLPEGWLYRPEFDQRGWIQATRALLELSQQVGQRIVALDRMTKSGATFAIDLPSGAEIKRGAAGDIVHLSLDLPKMLDGGDGDRRRIEVLRDWLSKNAGAIDKAVADQSVLNLWGDYPKADGKLLLNGRGDVLAADADKVAGSGVTADYNLVECRLDIKEIDGMISVKSIVQYQKIPWYGYMNSRAENVGKPIVTTNVYKPDAFVRVPSGSGDCLIQAKDLESWRDSQRRWHYGGKTLMAVMDGAMTVSGGVGLYTALKTGVRTIGWQVAAKHGFHFGLGASGLLNNAGANEITALRYANYGRTACFVGAASWHLLGGAAKSSLSRIAAAEGASQQIGAAQTLGRVGASASTAEGLADGLASVGNLAFQPILLRDLYHAGNEALFGTRRVAVPRKR